MAPLLLSGSAHPALSRALAGALGVPLGEVKLERFPDGELCVEVPASVSGREVVLLQTLAPAAESALLELVFLADACRRAGAARISAVVPYLAYARQDRAVSGREPIGALIVAGLLERAGLDEVWSVEVHSAAAESAFRIPLRHLSALPLLAEALGRDEKRVVVSPDRGGMARAARMAELLGAPLVCVDKHRTSGAEVSVRRVSGEVRGLRPVIVDDMITTAGTIEATGRALLEAGCLPELTVVATHALLVGPAVARLSGLPVVRLVTTDSLPLRATLPFPIEVRSLAPLLAEALQSRARLAAVGGAG